MDTPLPRQFVEMLQSLGDDYAAPLLTALETAPSVSVRANVLKGVFPPQGADLVPWCAQGFYIPERPLFAADPAWHQGLYYVQDASSMIYGAAIASVLRQHFTEGAPLRYFDACAAPGGKTIAAIEALPAGSLVVANEFDRHRANILAENIAKSGAPDVIISRGDAAKAAKLKEAFDIIAVDAPCSGEGMMRKEPEARRQWSQGLIDDCAATQRHLLERLWNALAPGGVLIYSTCTFNHTENEECIAHLVETADAEPVDLGLTSYAGVFPGIGTSLPCYRLAPGHVRGEGLFIAAVRKKGAWEPREENSRKKAARADSPVIARCIHGGERYDALSRDNTLFAIDKRHKAFAADICKVLDVLRPGLPVATTKGRDTIPTHELAMCAALDSDAMPRLELDYAAAMRYLRGESLSDLPDSLARGYALACHGGAPLGLIKNIGRRANNLYPDAMRLRLDPQRLAAEAPSILTHLR